MKKILIQLDTDQHPSAFDAIAAYDADVDTVMGYGAITPDNLTDVVQGAIFPRGPDGLENTAFWVGGSKVRDGEAVFEAARQTPLSYLRAPGRRSDRKSPKARPYHTRRCLRFA